MKPTIVVDVGNSRIKWGRCADGEVAEAVSLPPDDPIAWEGQLAQWGLSPSLTWAVSGVHPKRGKRLIEWARQIGSSVWELEDWRLLPLRIRVEQPNKVGIDRLLDAVAATTRATPGNGAIIIDAGSAVTVDWVNELGEYRGGSIFPGLRLMAQALHDYTALLSLVEVRHPVPELPADSTKSAMEAGIFWAVVGGIDALVERLSAKVSTMPEVFLTGGDGPMLQLSLKGKTILWPHMTLEDLRLTAEALP